MGYQTKKFVPRPMKILTEYLKKKCIDLFSYA